MNVHDKKKPKPGEARSGGPTVQELLDTEQRPVPAPLREEDYTYTGSEPISADRYTSAEFHKKEIDHMWSRVWQMACREDHIRDVGDHILYELGDWSLIVVRTAPDEIRAFHNSCLHRGRALRAEGGNVRQFRCPFHGFTWNLDGTFKEAHCDWDFSHIDFDNFCLPEAKVGTWAGFVFVNFDGSAEPLDEYLGEMVDHFAGWRLEDKYVFVHVARVVDMNWKVGVEAFIESFHVLATHPQIMPSTADTNTQYDNYEGRHFNRMITAMAVPSPHMGEIPEQDILDSMTGRRRGGVDASGLEVPEGMTARQFMGELARQMTAAETGWDLSKATDSEMLDAIQYFVFPNFFPWGGYGQNIVYRFRPFGHDPNKAIMEVMLLRGCPKDGPRPEPAPVTWLEGDTPWSSVERLGILGGVFDQDMSNMPFVQKGLRASKTREVQLANYQESRIRDLHRNIDRYLAER